MSSIQDVCSGMVSCLSGIMGLLEGREGEVEGKIKGLWSDFTTQIGVLGEVYPSTAGFLKLQPILVEFCFNSGLGTMDLGTMEHLMGTLTNLTGELSKQSVDLNRERIGVIVKAMHFALRVRGVAGVTLNTYFEGLLETALNRRGDGAGGGGGGAGGGGAGEVIRRAPSPAVGGGRLAGGGLEREPQLFVEEELHGEEELGGAVEAIRRAPSPAAGGDRLEGGGGAGGAGAQGEVIRRAPSPAAVEGGRSAGGVGGVAPLRRGVQRPTREDYQRVVDCVSLAINGRLADINDDDMRVINLVLRFCGKVWRAKRKKSKTGLRSTKMKYVAFVFLITFFLKGKSISSLENKFDKTTLQFWVRQCNGFHDRTVFSSRFLPGNCLDNTFVAESYSPHLAGNVIKVMREFL